MALYHEDEEKKQPAQHPTQATDAEGKEDRKVIDATKIPFWSGNLQLTPPVLFDGDRFGYKRPALPVPQLSLGLPEDILSGNGLKRLSVAEPTTTPPWLPSPTDKPSSPAATQNDDVNKIWELDFDMDIEPQSLMGQTLMRLHQPLKTDAQESIERTKQILAVIAGKDAQDTPVGLQLINIAVNLLSAIPQAQSFLKMLCIDNVSVVFDPGPDERKYGLKVRFMPPK